MPFKNLWHTASLFLASILLLSYDDNPPDGRTGAPFNGHCRDCHSGNNPYNYNGLAEIIGLPDTIQPGTTYALQLKVSVTSGHPIRAGFQLVVVDKLFNNAGNLTPGNPETDTEVLAGREYLEHRGPKYFNAGPVYWNFNWTAPAQALCNTLHFYYVTNLCNGSGDFGDFSVEVHQTRSFAGGPPLICNAITLANVSCPGNNDGIAVGQASGGAPPYQYLWSSGETVQTIDSLNAGPYTLTVTDIETCTSIGQTLVLAMDTVPPQIMCPPPSFACAGDTVAYAVPTLTDNCMLAADQPKLLSGLPSGSVFPVGITNQVFQVQDGSGQSASCSFSIAVLSPPIVVIDSVTPDLNLAGTGSISLSINMVSGPVQYIWRRDGQIIPTSMEDPTGLFSGAYTLEHVEEFNSAIPPIG